MSLVTSPYLDPMDRGDQGHILERMGIPEVDGGICLALSIRWAIICVEKHPMPPNEVWHTMKGYGPAYFSQIARNHQAYLAYIEGRGLAYDAQINQQLILESKNEFHSIVRGECLPYFYDNSAQIRLSVQAAVNNSTVTPGIALLGFASGVGGHAVGVAMPPATEESPAGTNYLYDPNFGVFKTKSPVQWNTLLNDLFETYEVSHGYALPMIRA